MNLLFVHFEKVEDYKQKSIERLKLTLSSL